MKITAMYMMTLTVVTGLMMTGSSATATTTAAMEERGVVVPEVVRPHRVKYGKKTTNHNLPQAATPTLSDSCLAAGEPCNFYPDDQCCYACSHTVSGIDKCYERDTQATNDTN